MLYRILKQDLFKTPYDYYLCHCISSDFALGAGIALEFNKKGVKTLLQTNYPNYWEGFGYCLYTHATQWLGEFNLVTKENCWEKPTLQTLEQSLQSLKSHFLQEGINRDKIAMPKIGTGLDKLPWTEVNRIIQNTFSDMDIEILICDPNLTIHTATKSVNPLF